jgi:hypothetical protein
MEELDLTDRVRNALVNAKENGYDQSGLSPGEVAYDLITYDADLEDEDFCEVASAVNIVRMNG